MQVLHVKRVPASLRFVGLVASVVATVVLASLLLPLALLNVDNVPRLVVNVLLLVAGFVWAFSLTGLTKAETLSDVAQMTCISIIGGTVMVVLIVISFQTSVIL